MPANTRADAPPKRPGKAATPPPENNLPATQPEMTTDEWTAALQEHGFIAPASGKQFNRLSIKGTNVVDSDGKIIAAYNQLTKEPALIVQLIAAPEQYQALWFDSPEGAGRDGSNYLLARAVGRDGSVPGVPSIAGRFCRSHFDKEGENRRFAEDGTSCDTCPVHPFVPKDQLPEEANGKKCAWRGDVNFRILQKQADGTYANEDPTIFTLGLATTGIIEFVGASKTPMAGSVSEFSTNARIARLGYQKWGKEGILKARTMLDLAGVICELHILPASSGSINWNVPSFNPIDILEQESQPALSTTEEFNSDNVPF